MLPLFLLLQRSPLPIRETYLYFLMHVLLPAGEILVSQLSIFYATAFFLTALKSNLAKPSFSYSRLTLPYEAQGG